MMIMDRRVFLTGLGGAVTVAVSGCVGDYEGNRSPEDDHGDCPRGYGIFVGLRPDIPEDAVILGAEEDGLLELEEFSEALVAASNTYEDGMEDKPDESEPLANGMDTGELDDELDNSEAYVEYKNTIYYVYTHVTLQC